jgi:hypothetical protein
VPDQLGNDCPNHPDPGISCFCDEVRDLAAGMHRPGQIADAFGGYQCVCGDPLCPGGRHPFTLASARTLDTTIPDWWPKYRRYRRVGKLADVSGWLLLLMGLTYPSVVNRWWICPSLLATGFGLIGLSWRLHRIAGMIQVEDLEARLQDGGGSDD